MRFARLLPCALLPLAACALSPHAGLDRVAERGLFRVHALDEATAARVLAEFEQAAPRVLETPTSGAPFALEVWCMPVEERFGEGRNVFEGDPESTPFECIEIDIGRDSAWELFVVGHELGHAWLAPEWRPLPQILEEGLADQCGERADPEAGAWRRLFHALRLASWDGDGFAYQFQTGNQIEAGTLRLGSPRADLPGIAGMLALDATSYHEIGSVDDMSLFYGVGYALVNELGTQKLRALCERARAERRRSVPPEWVLESAGIASTAGAEWGAQGHGLARDPELRALQSYLKGEGRFRNGDR